MAVLVGLTKKSDLALQSFCQNEKSCTVSPPQKKKIGWNKNFQKQFTLHHRCIQHIDVVCELVVICGCLEPMEESRDSSVQFDGAADHPIVF